MSIQNKVIIRNLILTVLATAILAFKTGTFPGNGFFYMAGIISAAAAALIFCIGLVLLFTKYKTAAKGNLVSAALLLIAGLLSFFLLNRY